MRKARFILMAPATLCAAFLGILSAQSERIQEESEIVSFFDVLDLPARIDEPKLSKGKDSYLLNCAIANRSGEPLLGLRLILMIVAPDGKLRTRLAWSEESEVAAYSIKTFQFNLHLKDSVPASDRYFLAVDEVIGRETIWRAVDAEKALRAYSRGQHDVVPKVKAVANKDDRDRRPLVIRQERKQ
ncbi:MAG TPA: hypothetical protein VLN44_12525 [Pyrinomonadaceae bacterium]|nr:hypothetical protein [Pyrinomonadaceae bacterium]